MKRDAYRTYAPLNRLKCVTENVWIVDGPEIRFRYAFLRLPFPTRMTVIRLPDGGLWLHSPTPLDQSLVEELTAIGPVTDLVAPNTLHYWWVGDWSARFPEARVWAVSRLAPGAEGRMPPHHRLGPEPPAEWGDAIFQVIVEGSRIMEAEFLHRPSRTLVITDLIENFEHVRFRSRFYRGLARIGGVVDPDGKAPVELRMSFGNDSNQMKTAVKRMIEWRPDRLIMAHGRWYVRNAIEELRRAFRWTL